MEANLMMLAPIEDNFLEYSGCVPPSVQQLCHPMLAGAWPGDSYAEGHARLFYKLLSSRVLVISMRTVSCRRP